MVPAVLHSLWPVLLNAMEARFCYLTERLPQGRCFRQEATLSCISGWASDTFNTVLGVPSSFENVKAISMQYRHYQWPASWWLPEQASEEVRGWLRQMGWEHAESDVAMACEMKALPALSQRPMFHVRRVESIEDMQLFGALISTIFEQDAPVEAAEVREVYSAMRPPEQGQMDWQLLIGSEDNIPVATASVFIRDGVASINDIATHPAYRRRGIGTAMFEAALQCIHESGAGWCVLQASESGQPLYARQGFSALGTLDTWNLSECIDKEYRY